MEFVHRTIADVFNISEQKVYIVVCLVAHRPTDDQVVRPVALPDNVVRVLVWNVFGS